MVQLNSVEPTAIAQIPNQSKCYQRKEQTRIGAKASHSESKENRSYMTCPDHCDYGGDWDKHRQMTAVIEAVMNHAEHNRQEIHSAFIRLRVLARIVLASRGVTKN